MKGVLTFVGGGLIYFAGYQWDILPETASSIGVLVAIYIIVADVWSDPAPTPAQAASLKRLAAKAQNQVAISNPDRVIRQITGQRCALDPKVVLSEVLAEDDQQWIRDQVQLIAEGSRDDERWANV